MRDDTAGGAIRWRMHLPVAPEIVFQALATDDGRAAFWAESAVEADGRIEFRFITGETFTGNVLQRDAPFLFEIEYYGGPARFELTPDGSGGTDLLLTHRGVPLEEWEETHAGWLNVLFPLKAWLAHGVDLRNHDSARTWNQGYADQ
jgi:uncharacterized protein YndB with AHSA1/START domain